NPDFEWLAEESGYVSSYAAHKVWQAFGIGDRFGYSIVGGHGHCALPESQFPEVEAFVDKFLLDSVNENTDVTIHPYENTDQGRWVEWWGTEDPVFPYRDYGTYYEAECAIPGENWDIERIGTADYIYYVTPALDFENSSEAPGSAEDHISFTFNVEETQNIKIYARMMSRGDDANAFWIKIDDGSFTKYDNLNTSGWEWIRLNTLELSEGEHTLTIAICENGVRLDRVLISDSPYEVIGIGDIAENACEAEVRILGIEKDEYTGGFKLSQNYPNPFNNKTAISFEIPQDSFVSLKVYSVLGKEVSELAGKEFGAGKHTVEFNPARLPDGLYYYTLVTEDNTASRKMLIQPE
ncbi:MAG: T9SS type A sorting domain-containing protein, partial [Eudoraea sp.]|nr:T9SS type A sorting domain-containing protein [Eudoraea sp.]